MSRRRHYLASGLCLLTSLVWAAQLSLAPDPWSTAAVVVIGTSLVMVAVIAVVAILLQSSPLGYGLAWTLVASQAAVAALSPISPIWWAGVALLAAAGASLTEPTLGGWIRQQPPPTPIPTEAIALCLLLLGAGPAAALVTVNGEVGPLPALALAGWLVLVWYVRRWPGREWMPRMGAPILAASGLLLPVPTAWVWVGAMAAAAVLAWTAQVRLAVRPLVERGHAVLIPPELTPAEVLHTAGLDEKGHPHHRRDRSS